MKSTTLAKRFAATGVATALAAGALVGGLSASASATPVTNEYTCSYPSLGLGPWAVTVLSDAPILQGFTDIPAGLGVGAGLVEVTNTFTIPKDAYDKLGEFNVEDISFPDFTGTFGATDILVEGMAAKRSEMTASDDGTTYTFDSDGANHAFEVPAAGVYDVVSPTGFNMTASVPGIGPVGVPCALAEGATAGSYATINVFKNDPTVAAKAPKKVKKGKVAKIVATVSASHMPSGKVLLKRGKKTVAASKLDDAGKAVLKTKKLKPGKNKLTVVYKGDGYTNSGKSETFVVKVV